MSVELPGSRSVSAKSPSMSQNQTIYAPLNHSERELQVLVLKAGQSSAPLKCELLQAPLFLAKQLGYETVSYCWGDPEDQVDIAVEGVALKVPRSAVDALHHLRRPDSDRTLWIDSICLNQADRAERGHEVARMHEIYKGGQINLIWLGLDNGTTSEAVRNLQFVQESMTGTDENHNLFRKALRDRDDSPSSERLIHVNTTPLLNIFARPWFSRLWVVQEAALSKQNALICGDFTGDLVEMLRTFFWLSKERMFQTNEVFDVMAEAMPQ